VEWETTYAKPADECRDEKIEEKKTRQVTLEKSCCLRNFRTYKGAKSNTT